MRRLSGFLLLLAALFAAGAAPTLRSDARADETSSVATSPVSATLNITGRLETIFTGDAPQGIDELKAMQDHVKSLTEKVIPCTVGVQIGQAWGSGVIVSKDGYVLTAAHVAGQPNKTAMFVLHDGRIVRGKTLGLNRKLDAGLMKITDEGEYPYVDMGASGKIRQGQWCLAVGHPGGYLKDRGLVVRLGRVGFTDSDAITTDCTLVGGDSGGPLFDMQGRVIGINSRIAGPLTANLHVPVDTYRDTWDRLVSAEAWGHLDGQRPILGVTGEPENNRNAKIARVNPNSPAERAGLEVGDIVTRVGDRDVTDFASLKDAIEKNEPGDRVTVRVMRGEESLEFRVTLGRGR
jgi:serine protease Do